MASLLQAQAIGVRIGSKDLLTDVDVTAQSGEILALLGPNGAGKTTLLKALLSLIPHTGHTSIDGQPLAELSPLERARQVAYVPQFTLLTARISGRDMVAQGRFAHRDSPSRSNDSDIIDRALAETDCSELADRPFAVCSGGERARLLLARAIATEAPLLLLDEPTASLDMAHALHLYDLLRRLADAGKGIVLVQHQLAEALRWADQVLVLQSGNMVTTGPTGEVLTADLIEKVFGLRMRSDGIHFELATKGAGHAR